jgi:hypothetical protein
MKKFAFVVLAAAAGLLAGCVVTSIYPYYTEKDLVFDPALIGNWAEAGKTNDSSEFVRVERVGEKGYRATFFGNGATNSSDVYLFRLKQQLFVDTCPTNRSLDFVPAHQVSKVTQLGPGFVETANLNYDWFSKLLENNPSAIRHMVLRDGRVVLTADTKDLQRFILKNVNNTNAWRNPSRLKRLN